MLQQTINQQLSTQIDGINIPNATFYISLQELKQAALEGKPIIVGFNSNNVITEPGTVSVSHRALPPEQPNSSDTGTNTSQRTFHS